MRKLMVAINVTLDGFADHTTGIVDDELHFFFAGLFDSAGALLFGRLTYQLMEDYWPLVPGMPSAEPGEIEFARRINALPKIVFSRTLADVTWNNSRIVRGDVPAEVRRLKAEPGKDLFLGGLTLVSPLTDLGLIDEYWLVVHPIFSGKGRRLLEDIHSPVGLSLLETHPLQSGVVALHYRVAS